MASSQGGTQLNASVALLIKTTRFLGDVWSADKVYRGMGKTSLAEQTTIHACCSNKLANTPVLVSFPKHTLQHIAVKL